MRQHDGFGKSVVFAMNRFVATITVMVQAGFVDFIASLHQTRIMRRRMTVDVVLVRYDNMSWYEERQSQPTKGVYGVSSVGATFEC